MGNVNTLRFMKLNPTFSKSRLYLLLLYDEILRSSVGFYRNTTLWRRFWKIRKMYISKCFHIPECLRNFALGNNPKPDICGLCMTGVWAEDFPKNRRLFPFTNK